MTSVVSSEPLNMTHSAMPAQRTEQSHCGVVTSVRGSVVDVRFDDRLPPIYSLLRAWEENRKSQSRC